MGLELYEPADWALLEQIFMLHARVGQIKNKVICLDIDGVIGEKADIKDMGGTYVNNTPNKEIINICNKLYASGNKFILYTARGSGSGIDWSDITKHQLEKWGLKYHHLYFGKPAADFYIDDKMLSLECLRFVAE